MLPRFPKAAARDYSRWSRSRYSNFAGEINHLKTWLRQRVEWIDSRWIEKPEFDVTEQHVAAGTEVKLSADKGQVYYTLDGSDPRDQNGEIRPGAIPYSQPIVNQRIYHDHGTVFFEWSRW